MNHRGVGIPRSVIHGGEPARGGLEGDRGFKRFNLNINHGMGVGADENVVEDYLNHLNLVRKVGCRCEIGADDLLQLFSGLKQVVKNGGDIEMSCMLWVVLWPRVKDRVVIDYIFC